MGIELVGPFRVPEGVKMTSVKYAPSHAARNTSALLAAMGIKGEKLLS